MQLQAKMYKSILIILSILLITTMASAADKWDKVDLALAGTFLVGQAINYAHINETINNDYWYEINPLMPARSTGELIAWKVGSSLLTFGVAHFLPSKWRKGLLGSANIIVWGFVAHDYSVGVSMKW